MAQKNPSSERTGGGRNWQSPFASLPQVPTLLRPPFLEAALREADDSLRFLLTNVPEVDVSEIDEAFCRHEEICRGRRRPVPEVAMPADAPNDAERRVIEEIQRLRSRLALETQSQAERRLRDLVGGLTEKLEASYAWLFIFDRDKELLTPIVTQNTKRRSPLRLDDRSIVTRRIAAAKSEYVTGAVRQDEYYLEDTGDSESALGVPILARDESLLGVLYFESGMPSAFTTAQMIDLRTSVTKFVVPLVALQAINDRSRPFNTWFPIPFGWDLERLLSRWLHCLTEALGNYESPGPCISVWAADWAKERMWALATTGYDYEYLRDRTLSIRSFVGDVASLPRGTVRHGEPNDLVCSKKARRMGLGKVVSTPIYLPGDEESGRGSGALNLYFSHDDCKRNCLSDSFVADLAETISAIAWDFQNQKLDMCVAHIQERLRCSQSPLTTVADEIRKCLEADQCSLFVLDEAHRELVTLATTGLESTKTALHEPTQTLGQVDTGDMVYHVDLSSDEGFTVFLSAHPGTCARKNDVPDPDEKGLPAGFPERPTNKFREPGAASDTDHRRFLGSGVEGARVRGVIRLLRSAESKPFRNSDELLLAQLADTTLRPLLGSQTLEALRCRKRSEGGRELARAVTRLAKPLVNVHSSLGKRVNDLLQSLVTVFRQVVRTDNRGEAEVLACFHEYKGRQGHSSLDLYEYHSSTKHNFSRDESPIVVGEFGRTKARQVVLEKAVFSCDWGTGLFDVVSRRGQRLSQAAMPVVAWGAGRLMQGVLSVTIRSVFKWKPEHLRLLHQASLALSATFGAGGQSMPIKVLGKDVHDDVHQYLGWTNSRLRTNWCELLAGEPTCRAPVATWGHRRSRPAGEWTEVESPQFESAAYPIQLAADRSEIRIPLCIGPFEVAILAAGPVRGAFLDTPFEDIGSACGVWSRLVADMPGGWDASFTGERAAAGVVRWGVAAKLNLPPPTLTDHLTAPN